MLRRLTQTFATEADDLHDLLQAAGEPGPYVVVGHSFGGAEASPSPTGSPRRSRVCSWSTPARRTGRRRSARSPMTGRRRQPAGATPARRSPTPIRTPNGWTVRKAFAEVAAVRSLGDLPVTVMTRAEVVYPDLPDGTEEELAAAWQRGQQHWASLSSSGRVVPVADNG